MHESKNCASASSRAAATSRLNAVIKSVVYRATELGHEVYGIRRGWEGLTHMKPGPGLDPDYIVPLDRVNTRSIDRTGGTWLHTSRTNAAR